MKIQFRVGVKIVSIEMDSCVFKSTQQSTHNPVAEETMLSPSEALSGVYCRTVDVASFCITESPDLYAPFCRFVLHILTKANASFEWNRVFVDGYFFSNVTQGLMFRSKEVMKFSNFVEFVIIS